MSDFNPEKAYIFRITHVDNVLWILEHGIHCRNSPKQDPNFVNIGNPDLIDKRSRRPVPTTPGGTLSDYVPFYFTPYSMMLYNIHTGYGGITRRANAEIVILVTSLFKVSECGLPFVFTNQHAYPVDTDFHTDLDRLPEIDWDLLQRRDFRTSDDDPDKQKRYQAEALVHHHVPLNALLGIACHSERVKSQLDSWVAKRDCTLKVKVKPRWYFT